MGSKGRNRRGQGRGLRVGLWGDFERVPSSSSAETGPSRKKRRGGEAAERNVRTSSEAVPEFIADADDFSDCFEDP